MSLTILTANLVTAAITDYLVSYKWETKPMRFTLISMAIITVVFYPLFTRLEEWLNQLSKKFVKAGHSIVGKYIGLILMYWVGLFILFHFYARMWYHINVFQMLIRGELLSGF